MVHRRVDVPQPHHYVSMHEHCRVEVTMHVYLAVAINALARLRQAIDQVLQLLRAAGTQCRIVSILQVCHQ